MLATLNTIFIILGFCGAWAALWIYGVSAKWWRNQIGRFLMTQAGVISAVYFEGILRTVFHIRLPGWLPLVTNAAVAALMVYHAWVFAYLIYNNRSRDRASQVDVRNEKAEQDTLQ